MAEQEISIDAPVPVRPESLLEFRLGRLLLLLGVAAEGPSAKPMDIERLAFSDFFSANPFLVFQSEKAERTALVIAGFDSRTLSYQSSAQRFSNRRQRLQHDLAALVGFGLISVRPVQGRLSYSLTEKGSEVVSKLTSLYALSFVESARLVLRHLNRLSDKRLREEAKTWLRAETLMIDLYDVEEPIED